MNQEADHMAEVLGPIGELAAHATRYASHGLDIFPVNPGDKTPLVSQYEANTDVAIIARWWQVWPTALIGHRVHPDHVILDIDPRHGGLDTWNRLKSEYGIVPKSRYHASGRGDGGGHLWFVRPADKLTITPLDAWAKDHGTGHPIVDAKGEQLRWSGGIDILHHTHRYTILPPSPHPDTGAPYQWKYGLDRDPVPLPGWLADLITDNTPPAPPRPPPGPTDPDSIADWYTTTHPFSQLLPAYGWTLRAGNGDDDGSRWRHPTATTAFSATVRHGYLFVYSPNTPLEPTAPGAPHGYTPFAVYGAYEHRNDLKAAARAARDMRGGNTRVHDRDVSWADVGGSQPAVDPDTGEILDDDLIVAGRSWQRTDVATVVNGITTGTLTRPAPTIGRYTTGPDGALWYRGRVNGLYGEPGKGKTMLAVAVAAQCLNDGHTVAWIDIEEPVAGIIQRLLDLGAPANAIRERFAHYAPEEPIRYALKLLDELVALNPAFVVIDSTGEALALEGAKPNNDDEVANWFRTWARRIANTTGAAVTVIDHVVKDETTRGLWPGGSQRKKAAINGSAFMLTPIDELGRGVDGRLKITTSKDRSGVHRTGRKAAEFILRADGTWQLSGETEDGDGIVRRPTYLMERISRQLELETVPRSARWVEKEVRGKGEYLRRALERLIEEGFVTRSDDGLTCVRAFRQDDEQSGLDAQDIADMFDGDVVGEAF